MARKKKNAAKAMQAGDYGEHIIESYDMPIAATDVGAIQDMLRKHEVFCVSIPGIDCYDVLTFRQEHRHRNTDICVLLDRNVLEDVLSVARPAAKGLTQKSDERGRIGSAIMAFCQCSNMLVEPCIALYENPQVAAIDLKLFRQAYDIDTQIYAQIALGTIDCLPANSLPSLRKPLPSVDFNMHLKGRRNIRIALLKIAKLDLTELPPFEKMQRFLLWSHEDFCVLAAATLLAAMHFTPHRTSTILRNLRAVDRNRALQGIQNAVWDIQIIVEWNRRVKKHDEERRFWLLCSRDVALKRIATAFYAEDKPQAKEGKLRQFLVDNWGATDGTRILQLILDIEKKSDDPIRSKNQSKPTSYLQEMEQKLEGAIVAWKPN